jgi:hypothetical protein
MFLPLFDSAHYTTKLKCVLLQESSDLSYRLLLNAVLLQFSCFVIAELCPLYSHTMTNLEKTRPGPQKSMKSHLIPCALGSLSVIDSANDAYMSCKKATMQKPLIEGTAENDINYACKYCQEAFSNKSGLLVHERVCKTNPENYELRCEVCGKGFSWKQNLVRHERMHTYEKLFYCRTCGKGFKEKHRLVDHEHIHTGEKPYSCGTCDKGFIRKQALVKHEHIHTGEKPYSCGTCGKEFTWRHDLVRHKSIHTGEKLFNCGTCGKGFMRKHHLVRHEHIHTGGEKPFN